MARKKTKKRGTRKHASKSLYIPPRVVAAVILKSDLSKAHVDRCFKRLGKIGKAAAAKLQKAGHRDFKKISRSAMKSAVLAHCE